MPMPRRVVGIEFAQPVVELRRAQVERAVQEFAVAFEPASRSTSLALPSAMRCISACVVDHLATDDADLDQLLEAFVDHLAAAVQALRERIEPAAGDHRRMRRQLRIERIAARAGRRRCRYGAAPAHGTAHRPARRCRSAACRRRAPGCWRRSRSRSRRRRPAAAAVRTASDTAPAARPRGRRSWHRPRRCRPATAGPGRPRRSAAVAAGRASSDRIDRVEGEVGVATTATGACRRRCVATFCTMQLTPRSASARATWV